MDSNGLYFEEKELISVKKLISSCFASYEKFDDNGFLKDLTLMSYQLPKRILKFLNDFKYDTHDAGHCVLSTGLVDDKRLGATPSHWEKKTNNNTCLNEVMRMCYG